MNVNNFYEISECSPIVFLSPEVRKRFKGTLEKLERRILSSRNNTKQNKYKKISVYIDTCFMMRNYFYDVYGIIKEFIEKSSLPEDALEIIILDQVEKELADKLESETRFAANSAREALEILKKDKEENHVFKYEKTSERKHHDTVLLQRVIDDRQDREIIVFTNDNGLKNDLLMMNYLSSSWGYSIATVYISADAKTIKYQYPEMTPGFYYKLVKEIHDSYCERHRNDAALARYFLLPTA